ncbi:MotA/TolQ/ExbB proton channel family protein [Sphingomonas morindae]|uniref:Biopolymer transport protein ExbB n=1 Tax=Sphingomonas morindae TaxID=1541170 RepID=A0ABY4X7L8_9SPHN|nr:MotA/TolQ/ExbB proton channel family protein [Sphingomonas morindae]USI72635.1 MotA/TolQ/ExbB proton channel family protein [Sphingomonas morindae]
MTTPTAAAPGANPYGLIPALKEGGLISQSVFTILVLSLAISIFILFSKWLEQQRIINQAKKVRGSFWSSPNLRDAAGKLDKNSAYRQIVDDGLLAEEQHHLLTDPIDQHEWVQSSISRSTASIGAKLSSGLPFLATVGSVAPFVGLFGTVVGIYRALIKIGAAGQASIDAVAGPVGEALIMTALGLITAVPAVLAYNWLLRRNKVIMEGLFAFANDVHGYMVSEGKVRPAYGLTKAGQAKVATTASGVQTTKA